jgi:hypothetical protein
MAVCIVAGACPLVVLLSGDDDWALELPTARITAFGRIVLTVTLCQI